jgi:hypothetical protein
MKDSGLFLRIHDLIRLEQTRAVKRKRIGKGVDYLAGSIPVILTDAKKEWVQRLKEKIKNNLEL